MNHIVFLQQNGSDEIEMRMDSTLTWMDVTDRYVNFLQGCGFSVTAADIGAYLQAESGTLTPLTQYDSEFSIDHTTFPETPTASNYDFSPLTNVMKNWTPNQ